MQFKVFNTITMQLIKLYCIYIAWQNIYDPILEQHQIYPKKQMSWKNNKSIYRCIQYDTCTHFNIWYRQYFTTNIVTARNVLKKPYFHESNNKINQSTAIFDPIYRSFNIAISPKHLFRFRCLWLGYQY